MKKAKIIVIDGFPIIREGLACLINRQPDLTAATTAGSWDEALMAAEQHLPDLVIADLALDGCNGLRLMETIGSRFSQIKILALSAHSESMYAEYALCAGASGYVRKQEATERILQAIREVLDGNIFISEKLARRILEADSRTGAAQAVNQSPGRSMVKPEIFRQIKQQFTT